MTHFRSIQQTLGKCLLAGALALGGAGCMSARPTLSVDSLETHRDAFEQSFTQVYATRSSDGDYDIVLVDNPVDDADAGTPGKPLASTPVRPLRHLVHIHVMWTPMSGAKGDHPSATNAAINWYVWGDATAQSSDRMHYGGAGFVNIYPNDDQATFRISNTVLKLKSARGQMSDPIGTAEVAGKFTAPINTARVKELLAQLGQEAGEPKVTRVP